MSQGARRLEGMLCVSGGLGGTLCVSQGAGRYVVCLSGG